jgi:hypothetical protein
VTLGLASFFAIADFMRSAEGPFGCFGFGEDAEDAASPVFFIIMAAVGGPFDFDIRLAGGPFDAPAGFFAPVSSLETIIDAIRVAGGPRLETGRGFVIAVMGGLVTAAMDGPDIRRCPPLQTYKCPRWMIR